MGKTRRGETKSVKSKSREPVVIRPLNAAHRSVQKREFCVYVHYMGYDDDDRGEDR